MNHQTARIALVTTWLACFAMPMASASDGASEAGATAHADPVDYERDVKAVLKTRCFACHGALQQQANLRLDSGELIRQGGDSGQGVAPGKADESLIVKRVTDPDASTRMPPEGEPLSADEVDAIRAWITQGALTPEGEQPELDPKLHWAFQPITRPAVPNADGARNPIDAFIGLEHQRQGLKPQVAIERTQWIRRVYLDLVGVPPSIEQWNELLEDGVRIGPGHEARREQADRAIVDRLLSDPRHGERWARHWMDIWRYSDWWGLDQQLRNSQQHMWHWRDWIVESISADKPYDEMVRLMLAADELTPSDLESLRATGYLARNFFLFNRHQWMDETIEHVSKGFLGLTLNCAKCHDHKYDPITQQDYYRMRAFFEPYHVRLDMVPGEADFNRDAIPRAFDALLDEPTYLQIRGEETQPDKSTVIAPGLPEVVAFKELTVAPVPLPADAWRPERRAWVIENWLVACRKAVDEAEQKRSQAEEKDFAAIDKELESAREKLAAAELNAADPKELLAKAEVLVGARWAATRFRSSGADDPTVAFPDRSSGRRRALADWMTDRRNPLLARVAVNHIWTRHMGTPLVATMFDFGRQGAKPTHPELLDWLASEFIDSGWSMKHLHRLIVSSDAYRISSATVGREREISVDPENRWLWRREAIRLESQVIRDSILSLAGKLDSTIGGPPVVVASQPDSLRRSLYFFHSKNERNQFLTMFDEASVTECYRRQESVVPQQALAMTNSRLVLDAIEPIAVELWRVAGSIEGDRENAFLRRAFVSLLGFEPSESEIIASREAITRWQQLNETSESQARAYFVWALLNHNDFVTLR